MALPPSSSELIPDAIDDVASFLPSFADLRRKNLDALYGDGNDKSPKGYVDIAIRALCDLVNTHPSFVTLSSCSGRIAIFDPKESNNDQVIDEEEGERGGKGRGEWILVSHEPVDPSSIPPLLTQELTGKLIFKHEPLLLHVAASSLTRGRQFLSLALQLGFRESGLVVTPSRVTIAVRSHSLALTVPLAYSGTLRPPDDYLIALVEEANLQMHSNLKKLNRLESEIKRMFFRDESNEHRNEQVHVRLRKLPALNLWGHDVVSTPSKNGGAKAYVFGGYGSGPSLAGDESGKKRKAGRSNRIYSLQLHVDGTIAKDWEHVEHKEPLSLHSEENVTTWFGVDASPTTFAPCEGLQVCLLPLELCATNGSGTSPVIAIWGGRSGPSTPFGDLLLFEPEKIPLCFSKPLDVRGDLPSPRWGHTLTPLSGKDGMMAILIGGRDANCSRQDNVHILSLVRAGPKRVFTWIRLSSRIPPQFHHSVIALDDDMILIGGGLTEPNDLTECFSDADMFKKIDSCSKRSSTEKPDPMSCFRVMPNALLEISLPSVTEFVPHYGVGSCCLSHRGSKIISFIGGAPLPGGKLSVDARRLENALYPMRWFALEDGMISNYDVHYESCDAEHVSFAAMIHTCCVTLPMSSQFLILGGGVSSFAFGASFADCYHVELVKGGGDASIATLIHDRSTTQESIHDEDGKVTVFYVANRNAKALRTALDSENLLNKMYRMGKVEGVESHLVDHIAVPVKAEGLRYLSAGEKPYWDHLVVASGLQKMPLSTAVLGSKKQQRR